MGETAVESESFFQSSALLEGLAGTVLIGPEAGIADPYLQIIELTLAGAGVKGTSGRLRLVTLVFQILRSVLRT
jgi:hypothetical protein